MGEKMKQMGKSCWKAWSTTEGDNAQNKERRQHGSQGQGESSVNTDLFPWFHWICSENSQEATPHIILRPTKVRIPQKGEVHPCWGDRVRTEEDCQPEGKLVKRIYEDHLIFRGPWSMGIRGKGEGLWWIPTTVLPSNLGGESGMNIIHQRTGSY